MEYVITVCYDGRDDVTTDPWLEGTIKHFQCKDMKDLFSGVTEVIVDVHASQSVNCGDQLHFTDYEEYVGWLEAIQRNRTWKPQAVLGFKPDEEGEVLLAKREELARRLQELHVKVFLDKKEEQEQRDLEEKHEELDKVIMTRAYGGMTVNAKESFEKTLQSAVNPKHYRGMLAGLPDLGWLDIESRKEKYSNPEVFLGAVDMQEDKYMWRLGKKDDPLQERKKSLFYKMYAVLYMENNCKPIKADLVHDWMASMPEVPGECM